MRGLNFEVNLFGAEEEEMGNGHKFIDMGTVMSQSRAYQNHLSLVVWS